MHTTKPNPSDGDPNEHYYDHDTQDRLVERIEKYQAFRIAIRASYKIYKRHLVMSLCCYTTFLQTET